MLSLPGLTVGSPAPVIDTHVHTSLCNHATGTMEDYVRSALGKGFRGIVFLEHLEEGIEYFERTWLTEADFAAYFAEGKKLQEKYRDRISITLGVEIGYNPRAVEALRESIRRFPWDWQGLSYHFYYHGGRHLNMVSRRQEVMEALAAAGPDRVMTDYLNGLIEAVQVLDCNVLCHLDAVMRHHPGARFNPSHWDLVERLLAAVRQRNMHLEVNTSGFALRGEPYPGQRIIGRALGLGIPLTAGSDAHHPAQVGRYFDRIPEFLISAG